MRVLSVIQGSDAWLAARAQFNTASEAPAMMGASKFMTRAELLRQKYTGVAPEVDSFTQRRFDRGHEVEAGARAVIEEDIGDELYPVTGVDDDMGLLASFDGMTMDGGTLLECKLWNEELAAQVRAGELAPHYFWQLEQQLLVSGAKRVMFACSDGTRAGTIAMEYLPVPGRAEALIEGWRQFNADLAVYVPPEAVVPVAAAQPVGTLPALFVQLRGEVTETNLQPFAESAREFLAGINRAPATDEEFAQADAVAKACKTAEDRIELVKAQALAQTTTIDQAFRLMDEIAAEIRTARLGLEKTVKAKKASIRDEIVAGGVAALRKHVADLQAALPAGSPKLRDVPADFGGAIAGKKSVQGITDGVDVALQAAKRQATIEAGRVAECMAVLAAAPAHLVPDRAALALTTPGECEAVVGKRVAEEAARLERERAAAEQARAAVEAARVASPPAPAPIPAPSLAADPVPMAIDAGPRLKLGDIAALLGFALTAEQVKALGVEPVATEKAAKLYAASDFPKLCVAIMERTARVRERYVDDLRAAA